MEEKINKDELGGGDGGMYDKKGNSAHYQSNFMEYIREQERKYGTQIAYMACISQVDRYNQRAGIKKDVPAEKDLTKRNWYKQAASFYADKIKAFKKQANGIELTNDEKSLVITYVPLCEECLDMINIEINIRYGIQLKTDNYIKLAESIKKYE